MTAAVSAFMIVFLSHLSAHIAHCIFPLSFPLYFMFFPLRSPPCFSTQRKACPSSRDKANSRMSQSPINALFKRLDTVPYIFPILSYAIYRFRHQRRASFQLQRLLSRSNSNLQRVNPCCSITPVHLTKYVLVVQCTVSALKVGLGKRDVEAEFQ